MRKATQPGPFLLSLPRIIKGLCTLFSLWFIGCFLYVALRSLTYPFGIEWMEGEVIDTIQRVRDGLPLYTAPSLEYVPLPYTPIYYYLAALVSHITGVGFLAARLVSIAATLGSGGILFAWMRKEGADKDISLIASGLFFATYTLSGRWFDLARVDNLFLCLTLAGLFVFCHYRGFKSEILAALLLAAAFFTKQSLPIIALPILAAGLAINTRHALITATIWAALLLCGLVALEATSGGWFHFYAFELQAAHAIQFFWFPYFCFVDLYFQVGILAVAAIGLLYDWSGKERKKTFFYTALAIGCVGCSCAGRLNWGGYYNVLMPMHAALALLAALSLAHFMQSPSFKFRLAVPVLLAGQFMLLLYNPIPLIPSQAMREEGERFIGELSRIPGDVYIPELQFVQKQAGKRSYDSGMAAYDVLFTEIKGHDEQRQNLRQQMIEAGRSQRFDAILPGDYIPMLKIRPYYRFEMHLDDSMHYLTGALRRTRTDVFVPIDKQPMGTDDPPVDNKENER